MLTIRSVLCPVGCLTDVSPTVYMNKCGILQNAELC